MAFPWCRKTKKAKINQELSRSKKIPFNVEKLIDLLGSIKNFKSISSTHKKISIEIEDMDKVDLAKIKKIKAITGSFSTSTKITLVVGNCANLLEKKIKDIINQ